MEDTMKLVTLPLYNTAEEAWDAWSLFCKRYNAITKKRVFTVGDYNDFFGFGAEEDDDEYMVDICDSYSPIRHLIDDTYTIYFPPCPNNPELDTVMDTISEHAGIFSSADLASDDSLKKIIEDSKNDIYMNHLQ